MIYTDFTAIWCAGGGKKAYLMSLLGHATKWVVGWALGHRPDTELALEALSMASRTLADAELTLEERIIHHDQDTVYTGYRWLRAVLIKHRARISFSENGAKGNTTMEPFNGRFKVDNASLFHEAANIWELGRMVAQQIDHHHRKRGHSTPGYTAPIDYIIQEEILPQSVFGLALRRS